MFSKLSLEPVARNKLLLSSLGIFTDNDPQMLQRSENTAFTMFNKKAFPDRDMPTPSSTLPLSSKDGWAQNFHLGLVLNVATLVKER